MEIRLSDNIEKPADWPVNHTEELLDNIFSALEQFRRNPNYKTKEYLVSLSTNYDLNQTSSLGRHRHTEYEVSMINTLWFEATAINLNSIKTILYEIISDAARRQKFVSTMIQTESIIIEPFKYLCTPLRLYYFAYLKYAIEKNKSFPDQLIDFVTSQLENDNSFESIDFLTHAYVQILNEISYFRCLKRNKIWAFSRDELLRLFQLEARLINLDKDCASKSPLKGVLMTTISNYILKSRNNYNEDYICKYISPEVVNQSIENSQIWIKKIRYLNDEREQKVIPEIFKNHEWMKFDWIADIDLSPRRKYYVSSFCKNYSDEDMAKDYGACIYGYKNDRICDLIAPLHKFPNSNSDLYVFSQVIAFDVLYDEEKAKEEINYLAKIIDLFDLTENEKKKFLEEIMQYWILSVKDKKWEHENERRYVIFLYDNYKYLEIDTKDDCYLKLKTSLFFYPDFILGNNPKKKLLKERLDEKMNSISVKDYMYCKNCLSVDYDSVVEKIDKCSICGSSDFRLIKAQPIIVTG